MAELILDGAVINTNGDVPKVGEKLKDFTLVTVDLQEVSLSDYKGKKKVINIFPSVDTPVCAKSVVDFNRAAATIDNTVVLNVSHDLPFALSRFCGAEGIKNSISLSGFRSSFAKDYGVLIIDGALKGFTSRVLIVADENDKIVYSEQTKDISDSVNVVEAMKKLKSL